jgi:hypothetical protein
MEVIIYKDVENTLNQYRDSLTKPPYYCDFRKAERKRNEIYSFLEGLGKAGYTPRVCMFKDLGQEFDEDGMPLKKDLYTFYYDDKKAHTQWSFGVLINRKEDKITIITMKLSSLVKEEKTAKNQIVIKGSELRAIINEAIREEINKLLNENPQSNYLMS